MSRGSSLTVPYGSLVRVQDSERGDGCYKSALCSQTGQLTHFRQLPCLNEDKGCTVANQYKSKHDLKVNICMWCVLYW